MLTCYNCKYKVPNKFGKERQLFQWFFLLQCPNCKKRFPSIILNFSLLFIIIIFLCLAIYKYLFVKTIGYCWDYNKYSSYEQSKNDKSKTHSSFQYEMNYLKKTVINRAWWNDQTLRAQGPDVRKYNNIKKNEGGSIIRIFSDNLIEIEQDNERVYNITKIYPKTAEVSVQGFIKPVRAANVFVEKFSFSANFKCKHE
jgi:hypothetical protein